MLGTRKANKKDSVTDEATRPERRPTTKERHQAMPQRWDSCLKHITTTSNSPRSLPPLNGSLVADNEPSPPGSTRRVAASSSPRTQGIQSTAGRSRFQSQQLPPRTLGKPMQVRHSLILDQPRSIVSNSRKAKVVKHLEPMGKCMKDNKPTCGHITLHLLTQTVVASDLIRLQWTTNKQCTLKDAERHFDFLAIHKASKSAHEYSSSLYMLGKANGTAIFVTPSEPGDYCISAVQDMSQTTKGLSSDMDLVLRGPPISFKVIPGDLEDHPSHSRNAPRVFNSEGVAFCDIPIDSIWSVAEASAMQAIVSKG